MSMRRFVAYFFAVSAGSTVAFASTLMGQPTPPDMPASDVSPSVTASLPSPTPHLPPHRRPVRVAQVALLK